MPGSVLISGGGGFIGSHLCQRFLADGWDVFATSRTSRENEAGGPRWLQADLSDKIQARAVFAEAKPDVIYHLAGAVGAGPDQSLVLPTYDSLLTSTINVLMEALDRGAQRIVLSSSFTEPRTSLPVPGSPYAAAKWASSGYGRMFHALYGAPVALLRPFMTYGPGQAAGKLVPTVVAALLNEQSPKLSSGATKADWVYIDDVVDAYFKTATAQGVDGETLDLGSGALVSIRNVVEQIAALVGAKAQPGFGALPDRPAELEIIADTAATARLLNWSATTSLEDGLRQTIEHARKQ